MMIEREHKIAQTVEVFRLHLLAVAREKQLRKALLLREGQLTEAEMITFAQRATRLRKAIESLPL